MAKKSAVSQYLAQIGREGGKAKVKKGFGKLLDRAWYWARFITARSKLARRYARAALTQEWKKLILNNVPHGIAMEGLSGSISWCMHNEHTKQGVPGHVSEKSK